MYIYKTIIKNFRNLKDFCWKPNKEVNVLVGGNGVGKSNIAIALDYLLNPYIQWYRKTVSEFDYYNRDLKNKIEIEVWLKGVENFIEDDWDLMLEHIDEEDNISEDGKELILRTKFYSGEDQIPHHIIITNDNEYKLTTAQKGYINYKYIGANRNPIKELSLNNKSLLNSLLDKDSMDSIISELIDDFEDKSKKLFNRKSKDLFNDLNESIKDFGLAEDESAITLEPTELSDSKTLQNFTLMCKNKGNTEYIPINYQSDGIKNIFLLSALQDNILNSGVLYIEEIEQNIEPALQRKIIKKFVLSSPKQVFITTHSPEVLKVFKLKDIFIINYGEIKELPKIDNGIEKYYRSTCENQILTSLFSKAVLLVEGDAEQGGIPVISREYDEFLDENFISVIRCKGRDNIIRFARFFNEIGIKNIALYDNDSDIVDVLNIYEDETLDTMVICVPKDYEDAIVKLPLFKDNWKDILNKLVPYEGNVYINKLFTEKGAPKVLKEFYENNKQEFKSIKSINDIEKISNLKLDEYLHGFLHKNMAGISDAEKLMEYLYFFKDSLGGSMKFQEYDKIFKLIGIYINRNLCNKKCFINSSTDDACSECGNLKDGLTKTIQIKESDYGA